MRRSRLVLLAVLAAALLLPNAGGASHADTSGTWVGRLQGDAGFVALVSDGTQVVAYVCNNGRLGSWFANPVDGANVQLVGTDGSQLTASLGDNASGFFTKDGVTVPFQAHKTDKQVLFRADAVMDDQKVLAGWIKEGGQTRGTLQIGSTLQPAPSLEPTVNILPPPGVVTTVQLYPAPMTADTIAAPTTNSGKFVWGAVGDSFASGEGDPEHPINDPGDPGNFAGLRWGDDSSITAPISGVSLGADVTTCHRSDNAAAPRAERLLKSSFTGMTIRLGFVACSGATTAAMTNTYTGPDTTTDSLLGYARVTEPPQFDRIVKLQQTEGRLDALTMSLGGNDAGFGDIIKDCISPLGPSNCADKWNPLLNDRLNSLATYYLDVESQIQSDFGSVPVLIQEYPNPVDDGGTGSPPVCQGDDYNAYGETGPFRLDDALKNNVTVPEANFAYGVAGKLNGAVEAAAGNYGWITIKTHLPAFLGHGVCTQLPYANLNSAALRKQGQDIPNTPLFEFSSGLMHPNDAGYAQMGIATLHQLQPLVDAVAKVGLPAPTNLRVAAATRNGSITVRWNDRATTDDQYELEVQPARAIDASKIVVPTGAIVSGSGYRVRVQGPDAQSRVVSFSGGGQFTFRVRACQSGIATLFECGANTPTITGTNVDPAAPTGIVVAATTKFVINHFVAVDNVSWNAQPDAIEYVVHQVLPDGTTSDLRTTGVGAAFFVNAHGTYSVAACNRVSCSPFVSP